MTNKEYLKNRKIFADSVIDKSFFDIVDHWTLYCGIQNMARYLYIYDVFKEIANVPGDLAEFGSWRGSNVVFLAKLLL